MAVIRRANRAAHAANRFARSSFPVRAASRSSLSALFSIPPVGHSKSRLQIRFYALLLRALPSPLLTLSLSLFLRCGLFLSYDSTIPMKLPISVAVYVAVERNWLARQSAFSWTRRAREWSRGGTMTVKKSYYNRWTISPIVFWLPHRGGITGRAFTGFMRQQ